MKKKLHDWWARRKEMRNAEARTRYYGASDEVLERAMHKWDNAAWVANLLMIGVALISALVAVVSLAYLFAVWAWSFYWLPVSVLLICLPVGIVVGIAVDDVLGDLARTSSLAACELRRRRRV